jgi:hypothetical protein
LYTESTQMQSCLRCSPSNKQNLGAKRRGKPGAKTGAKNHSRHTAGPGGGPYCVRHSSVSVMSRPHCIVRNMSEGSDTTPCSSSYYMTASQPLGILHYHTHTHTTDCTECISWLMLINDSIHAVSSPLTLQEPPYRSIFGAEFH